LPELKQIQAHNLNSNYSVEEWNGMQSVSPWMADIPETFETFEQTGCRHHSSESWNPVTHVISATSLDSNFRWNDENPGKTQ